MQQGSRIVLNRQQLRQTILIDKLNQLWNENKLIYVLMLIGMFAIAIVTILYVLEIVVVPSSRYSFLEKVEAARFRRYIMLRKYQSSLLKGEKVPPPNTGNETGAVAGGGTLGVARSQHQHEILQRQNEGNQHQQYFFHQSQRHKHSQNHSQHNHQHQQRQHQHQQRYQQQPQKGN